MLRRTVALVAMIVGTCGVFYAALLPNVEVAATHLHSTTTQHPGDPQIFIADNIVCAQGYPLTGEEDPESVPFPLTCGDDWNLPSGAPRLQYVDTALQEGNRLPTATVWIAKAFGVGADATIADGTLVGSTHARINVACDDTADFILDSSSTLPIQYMFQGVPVDVRKQTTAWGATSGPNGRDERILDELVPPGWTRHVRYRSEIDFIAVGGSTGVPLANAITLNAITAAPPWGDVQATMMYFGADAVAPSAQLILCLDTPHVSHWELASAALLTYPVAPGLYPVWTSLVSSPGTRDEQLQEVSYHTSCKHVGGFFQDADNDCLPDTTDAHPSGAGYDYDADGLLDGIDLAWAGSGPCPNGGLPPDETADCDGDGRWDSEEHFSGTNPRAPDTDGDGSIDSGLNFACGLPPTAPRTSAGEHSGVNRVRIKVFYCRPDGSITNLGGVGGRAWGNVNPSATPSPSTIDNCPNYTSQTNTSTTDADLDAAPAPGDTNGRFAGTADLTHPDGRFSGDACSTDDDNDGVPDLVEGAMYFDAAGTDSKFCNTANLGVPAVTLPNVRDTDADGSIDGVECQLGRNPGDPTSKPTGALTPEQQAFFRLLNLTHPYAAMLENLDDGTTIAGASEARGLGPGGASQVDHDRDSCVDEVESIDVDGNRIAGDPDRLGIARAVLGVSTFAPPGSATPEEKRTADVDYNGVLGDPDRLAAARIVLTASLPAVPDYNLDCRANMIGYDAN